MDAIRSACRDELARRRLLDFCEVADSKFERVRHIQALCEHLEALERRQIRKLIVAMPPRHGKSRTCSQLFPAWHLGRRPAESVVLASYGAELAEQNSRRVRDVVTDDRYPFDVTIREDSRAVNRWATDAGGLVIAAGVGSGLTGFGADALIIDDPLADRADADSETVRDATWAWYSDVARTRLHANAVQLIPTTRWHDDDLVGRLLNSAGASEWTTLVLPAICTSENDPLERVIGEALWPERFPVTEMPSVDLGEISSRSFEALYQQQPTPAEGVLIKSEWLEHRYDTLPVLDKIVLAMDCASKTGVANDFSAIVALGKAKNAFYVIDVLRRRLEFTELLRVTQAMHQKHDASCVYIEDAASGIQLLQQLRRETLVPAVAVKPLGSKVSRVEAITGLLESGRVLLPQRASWLAEFERELLMFPAVKHDDQVDALALGLSQLRAQTMLIPTFI